MTVLKKTFLFLKYGSCQMYRKIPKIKIQNFKEFEKFLKKIGSLKNTPKGGENYLFSNLIRTNNSSEQKRKQCSDSG